MDDRQPTSSPPAGPALQPEDTAGRRADRHQARVDASPQAQVDVRQDLREIRKLVRGLPEPARTEALDRISRVSKGLPHKRSRKKKNDEQSLQGLKDQMVAYAKRVATKDEDDLREMGEVLAFFEQQLGDAARTMNARGNHPWSAIGKVFGMSAQGAYQKWARKEQDIALRLPRDTGEPTSQAACDLGRVHMREQPK
jgi:hypothetical protein